MPPELTDEEKRAVAALKRLAKTWPKTLKLFSWAGTLVVLKPGDGRTMAEAEIENFRDQIPSDGGDPRHDDIA